MMTTVRIYNRSRDTVSCGGITFPPHTEVTVKLWRGGTLYREIRAYKRLVEISGTSAAEFSEYVAEDNAKPPAPAMPGETKLGYTFNFCYDFALRKDRFAYRDVIHKLSAPIMEHLEDAGFVHHPVPGAINIRFFNQVRIEDLGGDFVDPDWDVFISHGVADKDYWQARKIDQFLAVLLAGPAWTERVVEQGLSRERIYEIGFLKLDPIFQGRVTRTPSDRPYILWAPTHKGRPQVSSYPACLRKIKEMPTEWEVSVSTHPANDPKKRATMQALVDADVVIADSGSTLYEAMALGKPVVFPDWLTKAGIERIRPHSLEGEIYRKGIGRHANSMRELIDLCRDALANGQTPEERAFIDRCCPPETRGRAGELAAKALMEIHERKKEAKAYAVAVS